MWLLNTSTAEQIFFADPNKVEGGYAILSHVWETEEDSFKSVRKAVEKEQRKAHELSSRQTNIMLPQPQCGVQSSDVGQRELISLMWLGTMALLIVVLDTLCGIFFSTKLAPFLPVLDHNPEERKLRPTPISVTKPVMKNVSCGNAGITEVTYSILTHVSESSCMC